MPNVPRGVSSAPLAQWGFAMSKTSLLLASALVAIVASAGAAEAKKAKWVTVAGTAYWGPLPGCVSVGGYNISSANPAPPPLSCIRARGRVAKDQMTICMTGTVLADVTWRPWKGCK